MPPENARPETSTIVVILGEKESENPPKEDLGPPSVQVVQPDDFQSSSADSGYLDQPPPSVAIVGEVRVDKDGSFAPQNPAITIHHRPPPKDVVPLQGLRVRKDLHQGESSLIQGTLLTPPGSSARPEGINLVQAADVDGAQPVAAIQEVTTYTFQQHRVINSQQPATYIYQQQQPYSQVQMQQNVQYTQRQQGPTGES